MEKRDFKGVWIPREIWLSQKLSLQEKVFLVEIDSLDSSSKGCFAGNRYFSKFFGLSEDRCSDIISSLKRKNMIDVAIDKSSGKSIRKIISLMTIPTRQKGGVGIGENAEWPLGENAAPNNTEENNTVNKESDGVARQAANAVIELFQDLNPSYGQLFKNKTERAAATRLFESLGLEKVKEAVLAAAWANTMPYAPTITTPYQLERKLGELRAFFAKERGKANKNVIVTI